MPVIRTNVSDDVLTIDLSKPVTTKLGMRLEITAPAVGSVSAVSAARVHIVGVTGDRISLHATGAQFDATGTVGELRLTLIGASRADLRQLKATDAILTLSGVSTAEVQAVHSVTGEASTISHVGVWGESPSVDVTMTGGSTVSRMGPLPYRRKSSTQQTSGSGGAGTRCQRQG